MLLYLIADKSTETQVWHQAITQCYMTSLQETLKYPRQPRDQYLSPNSKYIVAVPPPTPPKKWWSFKQQMHVASKQLAALWNSHTVKQSSDLNNSSIQVSRMSLETWLSSLSLVLVLFSWYRSFPTCFCTNIHDSVAYSVLLPIDIEDPHHYWNVVYR